MHIINLDIAIKQKKIYVNISNVHLLTNKNT